jgi:hypothetical protein
MEPGQEYQRGWHQCVRCGCTYPEKMLQMVRRRDNVLRIDEQVWMCDDFERCQSMKLQRDEALDAPRKAKP